MAPTETVMSSIPIAQPVVVPEAVIAADTPCVICGYNLRGLRHGGRCPECGSPINRSVYGDFLRYADSVWLKKLLLGVRLKLWNIVIGFVLGAPAGIAAILLRRGGPPILTGLQIIGGAIGIAAVFLITAQEPRTALSEDAVTLRKAVRLCTIIAFVGQLLAQIGAFLGPIVWLTVIGSIIGIAAVAAYFGEFIYLRRFALRIPNERLARSTRIVMWGMGITMALSAIAGIIALAAMGTAAPGISPLRAGFVTTAPAMSVGPTAGFAGLAGLFCVFGAAGLVFTIWYIVLLFGYNRAFREALAAAPG